MGVMIFHFDQNRLFQMLGYIGFHQPKNKRDMNKIEEERETLLQLVEERAKYFDNYVTDHFCGGTKEKAKRLNLAIIGSK